MEVEDKKWKKKKKRKKRRKVMINVSLLCCAFVGLAPCFLSPLLIGAAGAVRGHNPVTVTLCIPNVPTSTGRLGDEDNTAHAANTWDTMDHRDTQTHGPVCRTDPIPPVVWRGTLWTGSLNSHWDDSAWV